MAGQEDWQPLETGAPLEPGDRVRSLEKSRVAWVSEAGDVWELDETSELELLDDAEHEFSLKLWLGGLLAHVQPTLRVFSVKTPVAVAAVRGTEFAVDVDEEGAAELGVAEGQVSFQPTDEAGVPAGEPLAVNAAEGASMRPRAQAQQLTAYPMRAQMRLTRLAKFQEKLPTWRAQWKDLPPAKRVEMRQRSRQRWRQMQPKQRERILQHLNRARTQRPAARLKAPTKPVGRPAAPAKPPQKPAKKQKKK